MEEYIAKGHAKRIQVKESDKSDESLSKKSIWYLPHHPVTHPRKPEKVRIVFDCATKFRDAYLNDQRLQWPDYANWLVVYYCDPGKKV